MRKILSFQEFNPSAYSAGPDWRTMLLRYALMASIVVVPVAMLLAQYVWRTAPVVGYLALAVLALYVPALALVRKPSVRLTPDYRFVLRNPKTVDTRILSKSAASALAFFILAVLAVFTMGGDRMEFHPERIAPALKTIFTYEGPLDLVGMGFFILLVYTVVGGTISMLYHQVKYVAHAITHRSAPSVNGLHPYTQSLLKGTAPELARLRSVSDPARRKAIVASIVHTLEVQDASTIARAMVKSLRRA